MREDDGVLTVDGQARIAYRLRRRRDEAVVKVTRGYAHACKLGLMIGRGAVLLLVLPQRLADEGGRGPGVDGHGCFYREGAGE